MENFFYNDIFFMDISGLIDYLDEDEIKSWDDDETIIVNESNYEPVIKLDADWIMERIDDDRFSEEGSEGMVIKNALKECIDFDKLNSKIPMMYYESHREVELTKADLLENI